MTTTIIGGGHAGRVDTVVSRDGTEIAYQTLGKGRNVLIVPGALAMADDFDAFARELAQRFTVVTIERRGRGQSGRRETTTASTASATT